MPRFGNDNNGLEARASDAPGWQSALIDLSFEPIFAWDWDGGIIEWNTGAEKQYGFSRGEALGKKSHEVLASKHPVSLRRFLKKLAADGHWIGEVRHTAKYGRELIIESRQQVIVSDGRKIVVECNRDITERREGERQIALLIIIGELIGKMNNPDELLYAASKAVGEYFKAKRCFFDEVDVKNDLEIVHRDYCSQVGSVAGMHKLSTYSSAASLEMCSGQTVQNSDSKSDPRTANIYEKTYEPTGERSYVAVPLMREEEWKATLWISDDKPREWSQPEITLLEVAAERVWLAVEKRRNQISLQESEERYRSLFVSAPMAVFVCDRDAVIQHYNEHAVMLWGREPTCGVEKHCGSLKLWLPSGDLLLHAHSPMVEVLRTGIPALNVEVFIERPDGFRLPILVNFAALKNQQGEITGAITSFIDITERKRAEEMIRETKAALEFSLEAAQVGDWDLDLISNTSRRSLRHDQCFGYNEPIPEAEWGFEEFIQHVHPEDRHRVEKDFRMAVTQLKDWNCECRVIWADGSTHWIAAHGSIYRTEAAKATRMLGIVTNITERKLAEEALRESEARRQSVQLLGRLVNSQEVERQRFARDLHDQMGQRLTALRLQIASLHELSPGHEQFGSRVNRLQEISERLDSEVSFLAWELRPAALDDLGLRDAVSAFVDEWSRHHDIAADFHAAGLSKRRLDRETETHLYRITQEALNNAAKHADAKHITVLLEKRGQNLMLIIEDDGKGFDVAKKRVAGESGKGLGLLGMQERASLIDGEVEIESSPGMGTTVYARVPLSK